MVEKKFSFGKNWEQYVLHSLDEKKLQHAKESLLKYLPVESYRGKTFIDVGCGSGIFSLGAAASGCKKVISFDIDPKSVAATRLVKKHYENQIREGTQWEIFCGDILNPPLVEQFNRSGDIVYSWGVLHHTGHMWKAIQNAAALVKPHGYFIVAIYNKAPSSNYWLKVKRFFNRLPKFGQILLSSIFYIYQIAQRMRLNAEAYLRRKPKLFPYILKRERGMSIYYDVVDWLGGYPYEFATSDEIIQYVEPLGFKVISTPTRITHGKTKFHHRFTTFCTGNNEFVFQKISKKFHVL